MNFPKFIGIGSAIMLSSSLVFAWSIDGKVVTKAGAPLPGVKISAFNFAGIEVSTSDEGTFSINDGTTALVSDRNADMALQMNGNSLSISNVNANSLKVSVINALGKVIQQNNFGRVQGSVSLDLGRLARGAKFIRIGADHSNSTFMITNNGVTSLKKEGEKLPMFMFSKDGFKNATHQMVAEVETNVLIQMEEVANDVETSSSSIAKPLSSSSVTPSSSSKEEEVIVDCTGKTYAAGNHNMSVNVDGKNRTFIMHVPDAYKGDKPVPLVVDYHPIGGSGSGQLNGTTYKAQTDPEGVISLYPDGTTKTMGPGWNVGPCCSNDDDLAFSRAMIKAVEEKVCIDKKRVYATGFSMGGGMSNHVACFMSDIYAAVAPAAMDLNTTNSATCNPERPISIIMFRGTADNVCRYQGGDSGFNDGLNFLGAEGNFKFWAEKNGCTGSPAKNSNGCDEYSNCKDGVKVVLCTKQGGGHEQGDGSIGWPFLKSFTMP